MSSITKLLSENIIMSPPNNNNNKNTIYSGSVFPSFIDSDTNNEAEEGSNNKGGSNNNDDKRVFENNLTSHLLSRKLHESSLYCDARRNLYCDVIANDKFFDSRCQNQSASVEVCKTPSLNKPHGEPPNKPHDCLRIRQGIN